MSAWEAVIGLEVHVQLSTASKAFSSSSTAFGAEPNQHTDPTVLGQPGALPVFNRAALAAALRLGVAAGCRIRDRSKFARKHYFYPDLPKGYQISQHEEPLCEGGAIEFYLDDRPHQVALTRIHLEEDAGKSMHHGAHSLVDLNRAGIPLCEVVSEPVLRSAEEAGEYMRALQKLVRYLGISDGDMEKGQLRCDANVSIRPRGEGTLGTRTELKNINSFRFVQRAIEHEIARQIRLVEGGGSVTQETRLWDPDASTSRPMRSKEEAEDYRYFTDPDLPELSVSEAEIEAVRASLPELPMARSQRYVDSLGLSVEDARVLTAEPDLSDFFDACVTAYGDSAGARAIANWIQSELLRELNRDSRALSECAMTPAHLASLVKLIDDGTISGKIAKQVFADVYRSGTAPEVIVEREGLTQISDSGAIEAIARTVVEDNPEQAAAYRGGKTKLMGFFVGQVMKATKGQANPKLVNQVLAQLLS